MPLLRRKKMPLLPREKFNPRKHIDRRTKDWAMDVPASGTTAAKTFRVRLPYFNLMQKPTPPEVGRGVFSVELLERRGQAAKQKGFLQRVMERFRKK
ncbi:MAG: hypothetical protein Q8N60_00310 [Candidatus Diapherotrites archaeon]|nr:hypothetical protein [Candidatus Diapherotrites archaeon]